MITMKDDASILVLKKKHQTSWKVVDLTEHLQKYLHVRHGVRVIYFEVEPF